MKIMTDILEHVLKNDGINNSKKRSQKDGIVHNNLGRDKIKCF